MWHRQNMDSILGEMEIGKRKMENEKWEMVGMVEKVHFLKIGKICQREN